MNSKLLISLMLVAFAATPARTDDAVDAAIKKLASQVPEERDSATKQISQIGGSALHQVEQALHGTNDPEVHARLVSLLPWLKLDDSTVAFQRACGDQWFTLRSKGKIEGVEHHRAVLSGEKPDRIWTFLEDAWIREDDATISTIHHCLIAKHDEFLTPIEGALHEKIGTYDWELKWKFTSSIIESQFIDHAYPRPETNDWRRINFDEPISGGILLAWDFERVLERNTIAGLGGFEGRVVILKPTKSSIEHLKFVAEEATTTAEKAWPKGSILWKFGTISDELQGSVVISPETGLMSAALRRAPEIERSDEDTCRESGIVVDAGNTPKDHKK